MSPALFSNIPPGPGVPKGQIFCVPLLGHLRTGRARLVRLRIPKASVLTAPF